jgi:aspergillopepsin I
VAIGTWTATINGSALTYADLGGNTCFGGVQGNSGEGIQIFGDMLLKNFFAVFNGANNQFGLANKA